MSTSVAFSASVSNDARSIPASANAWSVGANTVNGPLPCSAPTRSACASAATNESWIPVAAALVGISSFSSAVTVNGSAENIIRATNAVKSFLCIAAQRQRLVYTLLFSYASSNRITKHVLRTFLMCDALESLCAE